MVHITYDDEDIEVLPSVVPFEPLGHFLPWGHSSLYRSRANSIASSRTFDCSKTDRFLIFCLACSIRPSKNESHSSKTSALSTVNANCPRNPQ